ncbi:M56 family metallopeptidase [Rhodohalobacter halophilus]|uniref:M56 family metallopeptidase n=1 Tax=Rhodohalobacter halophilus TaxID=1812810 RepID=UPI00083F5AF8|nr:M56 family metallopeptidase [Rhodohalobacter halophilus]
MIIYLIYSMISLGVLLLFYHLFLEKERMHKVNRGFLIFSLLFSFTIPLIPIGLIDLPTDQLNFFSQTTVQESGSFVMLDGDWVNADAESLAANEEVPGPQAYSYWMTVLLVYLIVSAGLFIRLIRIIDRIQLKADRNEKRLLHGCEIILLNENDVPYTFFNQIFLNKKSYLNGEIPEEVIIHEMTHAKQKHTLDVLLIESLKILFWFNPLLYLYKKAILLNHEFLADEAVLSHGKSVKAYQNILLKTMLIRPAHSLTSTLNYSLTKKRLQMMTQSKSAFRSVLKVLALMPLLAAITLLPGCDSTTTEASDEVEVVDEVSIEILNDEGLLVNGNQMTLTELESYLSDLPESPDLVRMKVDPDAAFGTVTDVQTVLRKYEALRINYSTTGVEGSNELERVTNEFLEAANRYMEIEADPSNAEELIQKYNEVLELYEAIQSLETDDPNSPPPPPLVPSPEKRLDISGNLEISGDLTLPPAPPAPPAPVKEGDLMQILMNRQGMLLMNEEPAELNDVRQNIKKFVETSASTPSQAVIGIKTDPYTPYDQYNELLDEIRAAYGELRNEAAQAQFGTSFSNLEENSSDRETIRETYPMKLSIVPPEKN